MGALLSGLWAIVRGGAGSVASGALMAVLGGVAVVAAISWHGDRVDVAERAATARGALAVQQAWDKSEAQAKQANSGALRESLREISRQVQINQEIQRDYQHKLAAAAADAAARAAGQRLRDGQHAAIVRAAQDAGADALRRYTALCERDAAGAEQDAEAMGQRALRAAAGLEAWDRWVREQQQR